MISTVLPASGFNSGRYSVSESRCLRMWMTFIGRFLLNTAYSTLCVHSPAESALDSSTGTPTPAIASSGQDKRVPVEMSESAHFGPGERGESSSTFQAGRLRRNLLLLPLLRALSHQRVPFLGPQLELSDRNSFGLRARPQETCYTPTQNIRERVNERQAEEQDKPDAGNCRRDAIDAVLGRGKQPASQAPAKPLDLRAPRPGNGCAHQPPCCRHHCQDQAEPEQAADQIGCRRADRFQEDAEIGRRRPGAGPIAIAALHGHSPEAQGSESEAYHHTSGQRGHFRPAARPPACQRHEASDDQEQLHAG